MPPTDFYNTLTHYQPLCCYPNKKSQSLSRDQINLQKQEYYPIFLINRRWWISFLCVIFMNGLFILTYLKFIFDSRISYIDDPISSQPQIHQYSRSPNFNTMLILCISSLGLVNISYLLTQFLNPGIRNLQEVPDEEFRQAKKVEFCEKCQHYKTQKFTHCSECEVCIWNYDHHCGFFGKCIGGRVQFWSFVVFLASKTAAFLILLGCVTTELAATT